MTGDRINRNNYDTRDKYLLALAIEVLESLPATDIVFDGEECDVSVLADELKEVEI